MRNRSRTASFRRSVISVAAAFAAAPGCATDHDSHGKDIDQINPPVCEEGSMATGCVAPVDCSEAPPERGAPCAEEGASCYYDSCSTPDNVDSAVCTDGHWELSQASCNPPPITFECPAEAPYGPCDDTSGVVCTYDCEGADAHVEVTCVDGQWKIDEGEGCVSVNPPPPDDCPDALPEDGSSCAGFEDSLPCEYSSCHGEPNITAHCYLEEEFEGGPIVARWSIDEEICDPWPTECPEQPPEAGAACNNTIHCNYNLFPEWCGGSDAYTLSAYCSKGAWDVEDFGDDCHWENKEG